MTSSDKCVMMFAAGSVLGMTLWACSADSDPSLRGAVNGVAAMTGGGSGTCGELHMPILVGQKVLAGTAEVAAVGHDVVVTVEATPDWRFSVVHVYLGRDPVPVDDNGVPAPGQFPFHHTLAPAGTMYELRVPFADLGIGCGDRLVGAAQLEMLGIDPQTGEAIAQTGWVAGPNSFDGFKCGWWFEVEICCGEVADTGDGCTFSQGYWKNHNARSARPSQHLPWPLSEDMQLCDSTWLDVLKTPPRGNAWYILAHQWIAARLNVAAGASTVPEVDHALVRGKDLLRACSIADGDRVEALGLATTLDAYNNGEIGPGHCGEDHPDERSTDEGGSGPDDEPDDESNDDIPPEQTS